MFESEEQEGQFETDIVAFVDPRTPHLGVRVVCAEESFAIEDPQIKTLESLSEYDAMRNMLGVLESGKEVAGHFPLNLHFH